jgi:hypothetical protein
MLLMNTLHLIQNLDFDGLNSTGVKYADAIVWGNSDIENMADLLKLADEKPTLTIAEDEDLAPAYHDFYNKLLS